MSNQRKNKQYFHQLSQTEIDEISNKTSNFITKNYKQPTWCKYPQALSITGCWSLYDFPKNGTRKMISKEFCKNCKYYN